MTLPSALSVPMLSVHWNAVPDPTLTGTPVLPTKLFDAITGPDGLSATMPREELNETSLFVI